MRPGNASAQNPLAVSPSRRLAAALAVLLTLLGAAPAPGSVEAVFDSLPGAHAQGHMRLLTENHQAWYSRWKLLESATTSVDCTFFGASNDIIGRSLLGLLVKKAKAGVAVRLMVDQRGALTLFNPVFHQDYLPALASLPNVQVHIYNSWHAPLLRVPQALLLGIASNHSKIVIVDGKRLVAGGRNLMKHWFASPADDPRAINDADVVVRGGDVAAQAVAVFRREFDGMRNLKVKPLPEAELPKVFARLETARAAMEAHMTRHPLPEVTPTATADGTMEDTLQSLEEELALFKSMRGYASFELFPDPEQPRMVVLGKGSAATPGHNEITEALIRLIGAAKQEIVIGSAYMVLTDRAREALRAASARGVPIRVLTNSPESTHSLLTQAWFVKEWKDYMKAIPGMRLFAIAEKRKLHAKVFVFDGKVSVVGSYNMDPMSETINGEDVVVIRSPKQAGAIRAWLDDVNRSAIEYKIRLDADGTPRQVVGPSDHCTRWMLWLLKAIGSFDFLRPMV